MSDIEIFEWNLDFLFDLVPKVLTSFTWENCFHDSLLKKSKVVSKDSDFKISSDLIIIWEHAKVSANALWCSSREIFKWLQIQSRVCLSQSGYWN